MHLLSFLTDFGDPYLTVPAALAIQCWLSATRQRNAARCWATGFVCGAGLVALTKFVYAGWNVGIPVLHFTGISGHTMLSASVYPVAAAICAYHSSPATTRRSIQMGALFSLAIGVSRVACGYHSWSEVVSGWLLGGYVALLTLRFITPLIKLPAPLEPGTVAPREHPEHTTISRGSTAMFSTVLIAIVLLCHGRVAPISVWIFDIAPKAAGLTTMPGSKSRWRTTLSAELPTSRTPR
jgi:membrane-associated phospholipid phosphatase